MVGNATIFDWLLLIAVGLVAVMPIIAIWVRGRRSSTHRLLSRAFLVGVLILPLLAAVSALTFSDRTPDRDELPVNRPIRVSEAGYVSSAACKACHPTQHASWHSSFHRTMTQVASPETVIGNFDDQLLQHNGQDFFLSRDGDQFFVNMALGGQRLKLPIVLVTGRHHMQVYWFASGQTRMLGQLPFVYLTDQQRWIPADSSFLHEHSNDVSLQFGLWNTTCTKCHTTHPIPKITSGRDMDSQVSDFGIACEACHGPGEDHVAKHRGPIARYLARFDGKDDDSIVNPAKLDHRKSSQVCAHCHSITWTGPEDEIDFRANGFRFRPGTKFESHRRLVSKELTDTERRELMFPPGRPIPGEPGTQRKPPENPHYFADRFWSDGMVRISGREYNGLQQSPCFQRGKLSCLSCHEMHRDASTTAELETWRDDQLKPEMRTSQACLQCHEKLQDERALTSHTHHAIDSSGSNCLNCHMPYTTYGLQKAIRSHHIDSPTVTASLTTGRPNACNQCHLDQSLAWTAGQLESWYGIERPKLSKEHQTTAASIVWALQGEAGQRALMAWSFGWKTARQASGSKWMVPYLAQLLDDPYDSVRFIAERSLRGHSEFQDFRYNFVGPRLERQHAQQRVLEIWADRDQTSRSINSRGLLLLNDAGLIDIDRFQALLQQRNDRRINLAE